MEIAQKLCWVKSIMTHFNMDDMKLSDEVLAKQITCGLHFQKHFFLFAKRDSPTVCLLIVSDPA
jgi:hypothetical protein